MTDANVRAILDGSPIWLDGIGKRDTCTDLRYYYRSCAAYGVISSGWKGKSLPDTYAGEAGPESGYYPWKFEQDTVLLVFWSVFYTPPPGTFFGLAPQGPFTKIVDIP